LSSVVPACRHLKLQGQPWGAAGADGGRNNPIFRAAESKQNRNLGGALFISANGLDPERRLVVTYREALS